MSYPSLTYKVKADNYNIAIRNLFKRTSDELEGTVRYKNHSKEQFDIESTIKQVVLKSEIVAIKSFLETIKATRFPLRFNGFNGVDSYLVQLVSESFSISLYDTFNELYIVEFRVRYHKQLTNIKLNDYSSEIDQAGLENLKEATLTHPLTPIGLI